MSGSDLLTIIGMSGSFIVTLVITVYWLSNKLTSIENSINSQGETQKEIKNKLDNVRNEELDKLQNRMREAEIKLTRQQKSIHNLVSENNHCYSSLEHDICPFCNKQTILDEENE